MMTSLGTVGDTVLALTIVVFILLIIVIIVALVCCYLWRSSWKFRSYYHWIGPSDTLFVDRTNFSGGGGNSLFTNNTGNHVRGLRPPERSAHTQTDLTAVVVLQKPTQTKLGIGSLAFSPATQMREEPLAGTQIRWSRINPKLYLNPWTYQKQSGDQPPRSAQSTPRRVYVEEF